MTDIPIPIIITATAPRTHWSPLHACLGLSALHVLLKWLKVPSLKPHSWGWNPKSSINTCLWNNFAHHRTPHRRITRSGDSCTEVDGPVWALLLSESCRLPGRIHSIHPCSSLPETCQHVSRSRCLRPREQGLLRTAQAVVRPRTGCLSWLSRMEPPANELALPDTPAANALKGCRGSKTDNQRWLRKAVFTSAEGCTTEVWEQAPGEGNTLFLFLKWGFPPPAAHRLRVTQL